MLSKYPLNTVKRLIAGAIFIALAGAYFSYNHFVGSYQTEFEKVTKEYASLQQSVNTLDTYKAELSKLEHVHQAQLQKVPSPEETGDLLAKIGEELENLKVSNRQVTSSDSGQYHKYKYSVLNIRFTSRFADVYEFISRLNEYERTVRIEKLAIKKNREDENFVDNEINLLIFSLVQGN